jgi:hypothetical protein
VQGEHFKSGQKLIPLIKRQLKALKGPDPGILKVYRTCMKILVRHVVSANHPQPGNVSQILNSAVEMPNRPPVGCLE